MEEVRGAVLIRSGPALSLHPRYHERTDFDYAWSAIGHPSQ